MPCAETAPQAVSLPPAQPETASPPAGAEGQSSPCSGRPPQGVDGPGADATWADRPVLDLHEESSTPSCKRWPENLRLLSDQGEVVRGRCKATNQCDYCAKLAAVENSELLALDALEGLAPLVWAVLTTRTATVDMSEFYRAHEKLMRALKRRWPELRWARLLEFTTGYGPRSGGRRRPHWNVLLKGVPVEAIDQVRDVIAKVWCSRVDADPAGQFVGPVAEMGGLMRYVALHFQKESQSPPAGFRGHRFTMSKGYLWTDTPTARQEARDSLFEKRALRRAIALGLEGDEAEDHVDREWHERISVKWRLIDPGARAHNLKRALNPPARESAAPLTRARTVSARPARL